MMKSYVLLALVLAFLQSCQAVNVTTTLHMVDSFTDEKIHAVPITIRWANGKVETVSATGDGYRITQAEGTAVAFKATYSSAYYSEEVSYYADAVTTNHYVFLVHTLNAGAFRALLHWGNGEFWGSLISTKQLVPHLILPATWETSCKNSHVSSWDQQICTYQGTSVTMEVAQSSEAKQSSHPWGTPLLLASNGMCLPVVSSLFFLAGD